VSSNLLDASAGDRRVGCRNLQDNITAVWEAESIAREVETYVQAHHIDAVRLLL
jgi:hypothetical protein